MFWCWTLSNYSETETELLKGLINKPAVRYIVWGLELAPSTGTPHYQGYIELSKSTDMNPVRLLLGGRAHVEPRKGSAPQASDYCKKVNQDPEVPPNEIVFEYGVMSKGQGSRTDLLAVQSMLDAGDGMLAVAQAHFGTFLRYNRGMMMYQAMLPGSARMNPKLMWLYGTTGSGKSRAISGLLESANRESADAYMLNSGTYSNTWWNGYTDQSVVVMDDIRGCWFPHHVLLRILDKVSYRVPIHGGNVQLVASHFIFTSNKHPSELYAEDPAGALQRRVKDFAWVYHLYDSDRVTRESTPLWHTSWKT